MKLEFMAAALDAIAMSGLMVGCAGSKSAGNPVAAWQADRYNATEIAAANAAARPVTVDDVIYKSKLEQAALAAPINAFATVPAALYVKVVTEVDQMAAAQDGRAIYIGVQNDIAAGAKWEELKGQMTPEDLKAYQAYEASIKQVDQDSIINSVVMPMLAKLTEESAKVAVIMAQVKEDPAFKALVGFELIKAGKNIAADASALGGQFDDTIAGANLWLDLLKKDKEAKAFMQDYPVE